MIRIDKGPIWYKDPDVTKDYIFEWASLYMPAGVTVNTSTFTIASGLTKVSESNTTTQSRVVISGGTDGRDYQCKVHAEFSNGLSEEVTFWIKARNQ